MWANILQWRWRHREINISSGPRYSAIAAISILITHWKVMSLVLLSENAAFLSRRRRNGFINITIDQSILAKFQIIIDIMLMTAFSLSFRRRHWWAIISSITTCSGNWRLKCTQFHGFHIKPIINNFSVSNSSSRMVAYWIFIHFWYYWR